MSTSKQVGRLAKEFAQAVNAFYRSADLNTVNAFIGSATKDELSTLTAKLAEIEEMPSGRVVLGPSLEDFVCAAEVFATIAQRAGKSGEFKRFVPEKARNETVRAKIAKVAPNLAKLCD